MGEVSPYLPLVIIIFIYLLNFLCYKLFLVTILWILELMNHFFNANGFDPSKKYLPLIAVFDCGCSL